MRTTLVLIGGLAVAAAALVRGGPSGTTPGMPPAPGTLRGASLSIPFVEEGCGPDGEVRFAASTFAGAVHVTRRGELVYRLPVGGRGAARERVVVRESVAGAGAPVVSGGERSPTRVGLFRGSDPAGWRSDVPAWNSVSIARPRSGTSVEVRAGARNVEKLFRFDAGADPAALRVEVRGAESLGVGASGELEVTTTAGTLRFTAPVAWQESGGTRIPVEAAYEVDGAAYGFRVGAHDASLPLVVDPLIASTFLGSGAGEWGEDIVTHWYYGQVYVTGRAGSGWFAPEGPGANPNFAGGSSDAFVARLTPDLSTLEGLALLGGTDDEIGLGVTVGSRGVWAAGETSSTDFPATPGVYGPSHHGGGTDGWVAKLSHDLMTLEACTYHGGSGADRVAAVDSAGGLRFAGVTNSTDLWRHEMAMQRDLAGGDDLFFAYGDEELTNLSFASYFGGSASESLSGIVTGEGVVVAVGRTFSPDFPTTPNAYRRTRSGSEDGFVVHIYENYEHLVGSTYLGGAAASSEDEAATGVAWAPGGEIFVSGYTNAPDFPVTPGAYDVAIGAGGETDAFVARFSEDLRALQAATFLGGSADDRGLDLAADAGWVYATGSTDSTDFPVRSPNIDPTYGGRTDAFVARFPPDLSGLMGSTYLGGAWMDAGGAICVQGGTLYVTGTTTGWDFPTTPGAFDRTFDSSGPVEYGFVTSLTLEIAPLETDSFILPKRVNVKRRTPAEASTLAAAGTFDTGSASPVFSGAATLTVGGTDFDFPDLTENRKGVFRYRADGVDFSVRPSKFGTSRAAFALKVTGAAAAAVDPDESVEIRFRTGALDGRGVVELTGGRYKLGRVRGALVLPAVFPYNCAAKVKDGSKDTLSIRIGLASGGATPAEAPEFRLRLGDAFAQTVAATDFVRKGDRFVYRGTKGAFTSVTLDYARERILATAEGVEVGPFQQGSQPVRLGVSIGGAPEQFVFVRMACKGRTLRY